MNQCGGNMKRTPRLVGEWDDSLHKVVAKRTLVGLSKRSVPDCYRPSSKLEGLADIVDVINVPEELFSLENLAGVISFKTWKTILSDSERAYLTAFLPKNNDTDHVVASLLGGENINFGNPFTSWGVSICSGTLHPKKIVERDAMHHNKKKGYYSQLRSYHRNMVANLEELKELWRTSKSPETELPSMFQRWLKSKYKSNSMTLEDKPPHLKSNIKMETFFQEGATTPVGLVVPYTRSNGGLGKDSKLFLRQTKKRHRSGLPIEASERDNVSKVNAEDRPTTVFGGATASNDVSLDFMRTLKVRRKTLTEIMEKSNSGEGLHISSMESVLGSGTFSDFKMGQGVLSESEANNQLTDHWSSIVYKDLPQSHKAWRMWKLQNTNFAKSIAEQCILQRTQVLQMPFEQEVNGITCSTPSAVDMKDFKPSILSLESIVSSSDGKTDYIRQSKSFETNISKGVNLSEELQLEDKRQELEEHAVQNLKSALEDASPILTLATFHGEVEPIHAKAETKTSSSFSEDTSNIDHIECRSNDRVVVDEASAIHDDGVSALHQIWSTEGTDTQVPSLEERTMVSAKLRNTSMSVQCSNDRETLINPAKGLDNLGLIWGVGREKAVQCDSMHSEQACTMVNSRVFESENCLPPTPCKELSLIKSSSSPSVSHVDEHDISDKCIYNKKSDLVTEENKSSEHYPYQAENHVFTTQYFPPAVTTAKADTSWKFSSPSSKYSVSGNQSLPVDHHFDDFQHRQRPFTLQIDPNETSLRLELETNHSNFSLPQNPAEIRVVESFCYENGHRREFNNENCTKPELKLLTTHGSMEPKRLPHWAGSSKANGMNQHNHCQISSSIPIYNDQITQHMVDRKQEKLLEQVSQHSSALHPNLRTPSRWPSQAEKLHRSEKSAAFLHAKTHASPWGNSNNFWRSRWMSPEYTSFQRPPFQRVDQAPHLMDNRAQGSWHVGCGDMRYETGVGTQGAFTCGPRPLSSQQEWAISEPLPPGGTIPHHQNGSSDRCLPGHSWMDLQATTSITSMPPHHIPPVPFSHAASPLACPQSSQILASGSRNGQLHPWMKSHAHYPP